MLLCLAIEELTEAAKAEDANAASRKTRFAYPHVVGPIYLAILRIFHFKLFVHLVGLVHDVDVGDLPAAKLQHVIIVGKNEFSLIFQGRQGICLLLELFREHWHVQLCILDHYIEDALIEEEVRLIVILLDEFFAFTVLVKQEQAARVEYRIPQQNCVHFFDAALRWELPNVTAL